MTSSRPWQAAVLQIDDGVARRERWMDTLSCDGLQSLLCADRVWDGGGVNRPDC